MADTRISAFTAIPGADVAADDVFPIVDSSAVQSKKVLVSEMAEAIGLKDSSGSSLVGFIQSGTGAVGRTAQAKMMESVSVKDFGAVGDGVTDDTAAIQAAVTAAEGAGIGIVNMGPGNFLLTSAVFVPAGITIVGQDRDTKVIPSATGSYTGGFMFVFNSTDGVTWTVAYPGVGSGGMRSVWFDNSTAALAEIRGCLAFGSHVFEDIRTNNFTQSIRRGGGYYSDQFMVRRGQFVDQIGATEYHVELSGTGDAWVVEECHFPSHDQINCVNQRAVLVNGDSLGTSSSIVGVVRDCIGGDYSFQYTQQATLTGCHLENSQILIGSSNVDIEDSVLFMGDFPLNPSRIPILCDVTGGTQQSHHVTLKNVQFLWGFGKWIYDEYEVCLPARYSLSVINSWRNIEIVGNDTKILGIRVCSDAAGTVPIANYNNYACMGSAANIYRNAAVEFDQVVPVSANTYLGTQTATEGAIAASVTWGEALGTYYYSSQILVDPIRLLGKNQYNAEASCTVTSAANVVNLKLQQNGNSGPHIVRVYRGTSPGSYTSYVDLPVINVGEFIYDDGLYLAGCRWIARAAGAVDTINSVSGSLFIRQSIHTVKAGANAVPTVGAFKKGDYLINTNAAYPELLGMECIVAGTPGTWKPEFKEYGFSADNGDASVTLTAGVKEYAQLWNTPLTAARSVTLSTTTPTGGKFRIVRGAGATGAFNLNVGTGPLKSLTTAGQWCEVQYSGAAWVLTASGSL